MKPRLHKLPWGDQHIQHSSVVNVTHVDPTLGKHGVRIKDWQFAVLVCMSVMDIGLLVGLVAMTR